LKKAQTRAQKPKKKRQKEEQVKSKNTFNNPLAEALIKSGFKS